MGEDHVSSIFYGGLPSVIEEILLLLKIFSLCKVSNLLSLSATVSTFLTYSKGVAPLKAYGKFTFFFSYNSLWSWICRFILFSASSYWSISFSSSTSSSPLEPPGTKFSAESYLSSSSSSSSSKLSSSPLDLLIAWGIAGLSVSYS